MTYLLPIDLLAYDDTGFPAGDDQSVTIEGPADYDERRSWLPSDRSSYCDTIIQ